QGGGHKLHALFRIHPEGDVHGLHHMGRAYGHLATGRGQATRLEGKGLPAGAQDGGQILYEQTLCVQLLIRTGDGPSSRRHRTKARPVPSRQCSTAEPRSRIGRAFRRRVAWGKVLNTSRRSSSLSSEVCRRTTARNGLMRTRLSFRRSYSNRPCVSSATPGTA